MITFMDDTLADQPLESDLSTELANFNSDKKTPLTLGGQVAETPAGSGLTAAIMGWIPVQGDDVIADTFNVHPKVWTVKI